MADPLLLILQVLHIACAATAFAVTLTMGGGLRRAQGNEARAAVAALTQRSVRLSGFFLVLTLATGLGLIFTMGGFAVMAPTIHVGMGVVILMLVVQMAYLFPATERVVAAAGMSDPTWRTMVARFNLGQGIMQLLWLGTLVLMFIKRG